ncbi:MAG: cysteine desulfurase family protein [Lachnospiraceae bacterium]
MKVYADHAATTQLDLDAFGEMKNYLLTEYGNASQPYSFARSAKAALKSARVTIARCINAEPEEIFFTSGGTESDNWAIKSTALECGEKCKIITSQIEHHAILHACHAVERMGFPVVYLPVDKLGVVQLSYLNECINDKVKLVSVMYANNEIGTIQPIKELCNIAHSKGALFHTDAVQAVGHVPIDVRDLGVDMLSASAHKFNGPKGIGFLYVKKESPVSPYLDGGAQEFGMRAGTENIASIVAMAIALEKNCRKMERNADHLKKLEDIFIGELQVFELDFKRNGSDYKIPGNISLSFRDAEGEMLLHRLDLMGICVSTGSACDSKNTQISHVLEAIRVPQEYAVGTIRISLGPENTEEEVRYIAKSIYKILKS